jgi:hypothetical protein
LRVEKNTVIRRARIDDLAEIIGLLESELGMAVAPDKLQKPLDYPNELFLVWDSGGRIDGFRRASALTCEAARSYFPPFSVQPPRATGYGGIPDGKVRTHLSQLNGPTPSRADIEMTKAIIEVAKPLGIAVHDHLIVGKAGHAS